MTLTDKILALSDNEACEAGQFLAIELGASPDAAIRDDLAADPLLTEKGATPTDIGQLARVLLLIAAEDPESTDAVERSVAAVGRQFFVLGGAEIVILAGLLVTAYQIHVTKGIKEVSRRTTIERSADGAEKVVISEKTKFNVTNVVAGMLRRLVPDGK
jgi:hypothetical protein